MVDPRLSPDIIEFLNRKATVNFLTAAREFVELLETAGLSDEEFYRRSHLALSKLYAAGHALDKIELVYSDADSEYQEDKLFENKNLRQISNLGEEAFYGEIFDPAYDKEEIVQGWLTDDFCDIYRDLKTELTKMDTIVTDEAVEDALWQMKWSFHRHWGNHCIDALRALHYLVYDGKGIM